MKPFKKRMTLDFHLLGLIASLAIINTPLFLNWTFPFIDTFYVFQQFYYTYNELFIHHEFPLWAPFASYGQQYNVYLLSSLSPASYITGLVGLTLKVRDVMLLFKISLFLEQIALLYGAYLLSKTLFRHKTTILFVCITVIVVGTNLQHNIYFNFRIFYLLPLITYFITAGYSRHKLSYFASAMLAFAIQGIGLVPYMIILPLFIVVIMFASLAYVNRAELKYFCRTSRADIIYTVFTLTLTALVAGSLLLFVQDGSDSLCIVSPGRSEDGKQMLESFLTYGGLAGTSKFFDMVFPKFTVKGLTEDNCAINNIFVFTGILPLFFAGYLVAKRKLSPLAVALFVVMASLGMLSIGKTNLSSYLYHNIVVALLIIYIFIKRNRLLTHQMVFLILVTAVLYGAAITGNNLATVLYFIFPGMSYYRHIGYSANFFKLILPFLAGFGLEQCLETLREGQNPFPKISHIAAVQLLLIVAAVLYAAAYIYQRKLFTAWADYTGGINPAVIALFIVITGIGLYLFNLWSRKERETFFARAVIFIIVFEMLSLRLLVDASYARMSKDISIDKRVTEVYHYEFHNERTDVPVNEYALNGMAMNLALHPTGPDIMNNQLYWSMCSHKVDLGEYETPWILKGINAKLNIRVDTVNSYLYLLAKRMAGSIKSFNDRPCISKKLSLLSDVYFVKILDKAEYKARQVSEPMGPLIRKRLNGNDDYRAPDLTYLDGRNTSGGEDGLLLTDALALTDVPENIVSEWESADFKTSEGDIRVRDFRVNGIDIEVKLRDGAASWLYFTDAWHHKWKAYINDTPAHIAQANVAFKAIPLKGGLNRVSFVFDNKLARYCIYLFAIAGIIFMVLVVVCIIRLLAFSTDSKAQ